AQLTRLAARVRQARVEVDDGEAHPGDFFLREIDRANRPGGTDLSAGVAARLATGPVGRGVGSPQTFQSLLKGERLQHVVGARLETFAAADAHLQKLLFGNASRWTDGADRIGAVEI